MAISETEKRKIRELKAQGYTLSEIQGYLGGQRLNRSSTVSSQQTEAFRAEQEAKTSGLLKEFGRETAQDISQGFEASVQSVTQGMEKAQDVRERVEEGETTPVAGTLQTIGAGLGAGAGVVGNSVIMAGKTFLPEQAEQAISKVVGSGAEAIVQSRPAQEVMSMYENLSEEQQRNVVAVLETGEGLGTAFGFGPVVNRLKGSISKQAQNALKASDDALSNVRKQVSTPDLKVPNAKGVKKVLMDVRFKLSDLDPQVETVLKRSDFNEVNKYFQQARLAKTDPGKDTPLSLAAGKAETAYNAIDEARRNAVIGKNAVLENVSDQRMPGNVLNDVMAGGIQRFKSRFGAEVRPDGAVSQVAGRTLKLDSADQKLVSEYFNRLNSLGVSPTVRQVDDFVDWAQGQLYKQSKTVSKFEVAAEPVVKQLQSITGDINTRLKERVGGGYGEVNARVGRLIELQDELSRALGADNRKGAGVMKRLFSPTGDETRRIFDEIKEETGIDLVKEATLAKFSMESVGDTRQASLLKQLDAGAKEAAEFSITNPGSWYNLIRERADLDGQDLANEFLRRLNASENK